MLLAIGMPGSTELIIILVIVIIFFGVGKLPAVLGQMGKGVKSFKDGMKEDDEDSDLKAIADDAELAEAEEVRSKKNA
jgi:sec-independent protein translocase protein TatA